MIPQLLKIISDFWIKEKEPRVLYLFEKPEQKSISSLDPFENQMH